MSENPTVIDDLGQAGWTDALLEVFPNNWLSQEAQQPGGVAYAIFNAMAGNLEVINQDLEVGFNASRIATAQGIELDLVSEDFFGDSLPRRASETDDSFRIRIQQNLFIPYCTTQAFIQAITNLTGIAPRVIQPWNPAQTSAFDWRGTGYDGDSPTTPSLYGAPDLKYQGFIIATLPAPTGINTATAVWGFDAGGAYDYYTGVFWNLVAGNFITQDELDQLILRIKAFGITVWRKYLSQGSIPSIQSSSFPVATGSTAFNVALSNFGAQYVVVASCNWVTSLFVQNASSSGFTIQSTTPSPMGARLNYVILPLNVQAIGTVIARFTAAIPIPVVPYPAGQQVIVCPNWNTTVWITSISGGVINVAFGTGPGGVGAGILSYYFPPANQSGEQNEGTDYAAGDTSTFIYLPGLLNAAAPFVIPSWNTQTSVTLSATGITVQFSVPAPSGSFIQWAYVPVPA